MLNTESIANESNLASFSWPDLRTKPSKTSEPIWISRLRSGYTALERKCARWTPDASFRYTDCTRERLLSHSPETYFHKGEPFREGSVDVLIVDSSAKEQDYESMLARIVDAMGIEAGRADEGIKGAQSSGLAEGRSLNDKALYLARQFFRETL